MRDIDQSFLKPQVQKHTGQLEKKARQNEKNHNCIGLSRIVYQGKEVFKTRTYHQATYSSIIIVSNPRIRSKMGFHLRKVQIC
jgi:hypothetical protein